MFATWEGLSKSRAFSNGSNGGIVSIRVLVAVPGRLSSAALAALLAREDDLDVVADCARKEDLLPLATECAADVILLDTNLSGPDASGPDADDLIAGLRTGVPLARVLALVDTRRAGRLSRAIPQAEPRIGFVSADASAVTLVEGIRRVASGEPFLDSPLAFAALAARNSPLTAREHEVLRIAAEGVRVREIATRLFLAQGTVRNYLSRIIVKTGARSRLEAISIAEDAGWL
jgi:two-component system, NarL family, response regulator DesR